MSVAQRIQDLVRAVAREYAAEVRATHEVRVDSSVLQAQLMRAVCGDGSAACYECLRTVFAPDALEGDGYLANREAVTRVRRGHCAGVCLCELRAFQDATVNFSATRRVENLSPESLEQVVRRVLRALRETYGDAFVPTREQILWIVLGRDPRDDVWTQDWSLTTSVNQRLSLVQSVELEGYGRILNVRMDAVLEAVFEALVKQSLRFAQDTVHDSADHLREVVQLEVDAGLARVWEQNRTLWVVLLAALGLGTAGTLVTALAARGARA